MPAVSAALPSPDKFVCSRCTQESSTPHAVAIMWVQGSRDDVMAATPMAHCLFPAGHDAGMLAFSWIGQLTLRAWPWTSNVWSCSASSETFYKNSKLLLPC